MKELHDLDAKHSAADSSFALGLSQLDQQLSSRQVQISALQEQSLQRRKALQDQRTQVDGVFPMVVVMMMMMMLKMKMMRISTLKDNYLEYTVCMRTLKFVDLFQVF